MNKTLVVYHGLDLDGWCSGAIVKYCYTIEKNKLSGVSKLGFTLSGVDFCGYHYGNPLPDWKSYDEIIMCDISFDDNIMVEICKTKKLIWIDHHDAKIKDVYKALFDADVEQPAGLRDKKYAACELTWKYFFKDIKVPRGVELLGLYDSFRYKEELDLLGQQMVLEFQYASRTYINGLENFSEYLFKDDCTLIPKWITDGKAIYSYLLMDAREKYAKKIDIDIDGYKFCGFNVERFNPINFKINYHDDGYDGALCFWFTPGNSKWNFSFYSDNGTVDCSQIAKKRGGNGHFGASGCTVKGDLNDFVNKLLNSEKL